jgi:hypothetical protein
VLYIDGDKAAAIKEIKRGAAKNAPDQLREFAGAVKLLKMIPGVQQYTGPLLEVADILASDDGTEGSKESKGTGGTGTSDRTLASSKATSSPHGDQQSPLEPVGVTFSLVPTVDTRAKACSLFSTARWDIEHWTARCVPLMHGPLVVTDVQTGDTCHDRLLVGSGDPESPQWAIVGQPASTIGIHGAALFVPEGEALFIAQASSGETSPQADSGCLVTLSWHKQQDVGDRL